MVFIETATIISIISPYLMSLAKSGLNAIVKSTSGEVGKSIWNRVKEAFKTEEQIKIIENLENAPNSAIIQEPFKVELDKILQFDPLLAEQLKDLMSYKKKNTQIVTGNHNTIIQKNNGSTITINR